MITISLCMIVRDEEEVLLRCLESVKDAVDEIIIVDTGSKDSTKEIAGEFTDKIYDFEWIDDFSAARNFAFSKAGMQYCMWLDADDVVGAEELKKLLYLKEHLTDDTDIVMLKYNIAFDANGIPTFSYFRERIIKNIGKDLWEGPVHEVITPFGNIRYEEISISHKKEKEGDPQRNIRIFENLVKKGAPLGTRQIFYYAQELFHNDRTEESIVQFNIFIERHDGWSENKIEACRFLYSAYCRIGKADEALYCLFRSFEYDNPRAEVCCDIGQHFLDRLRYPQAAYWYELAINMERNDVSGAFVLPDCYGYIPALQLCTIYYRLGKTELSRKYNEMAGKFKPDDPSYLQNAEFFRRIDEAKK